MKKKKKLGYVEFNDDLDNVDEEDLNEAIARENEMKLAEEVVSDLGDRCKELLMLFYLGSVKLKAIAEQMGYSSEKTAKNQKYKCLEAAKNRLKTLKDKMFSATGL